MTDSPDSPFPVVLCALLDDAHSQPSASSVDAAASAEPTAVAVASPPPPPPQSSSPPSDAPTGVVLRWPGPKSPSEPRGSIRLNATVLRRLRHTKLLSQQDLANEFWDKKIKISIATIKRVESQACSKVRFRIAHEFARYYNVPVETLLMPDA